MVIVKLIGGIGNQMFQYAMARRVAHVNKAPLKLDIGGFERETGIISRKYELDVFNINAEIASEHEIKQLKRHSEKLYKAIRLLVPFYRQCYFLERKFYFDPVVLSLPGSIYLSGFWQSEKYFTDIEAVIRRDFSFKKELSAENKAYVEEINQTESIAIHIRRGDYVTNPETNQYHGVCSLEYYQAAVSDIKKQINVESLHAFMFSDDPQWVSDNLRLEIPQTFITGNGERGYEDLRLMTLCRHHIIANSSFSWWGAWLGKKPRQIVIAPQKWFNDGGINTADLLPASWIRK